MNFELMTEFLNFYIGYVFIFILTFYLRIVQVYLLIHLFIFCTVEFTSHFLHCGWKLEAILYSDLCSPICQFPRGSIFLNI